MKRVFLKITNLNRFNSTANLILIAVLSIFIVSCSKDDGQPPVLITEISEEIKDLIYFKGNEKASTVLINAQGGPSTEFNTFEVDLFFENFNTTDILMANVHQAQTLTPDILEGKDITLGQAINFNTESIEMLYKVISYFKNQGRTVYVLGNSYGSFIVQELIAKKGIDSADKYLIITGRLDIDDVIWEGAAEGRESSFENGVTPIVAKDPDVDVFERNSARLFAGIAMNRYTQDFYTIEDLSNVTYIYGATDEAVGRLTPEEVLFLEAKNTNIIAGSGDHDTTFWEFIAQGLKEAFGIKELTTQDNN